MDTTTDQWSWFKEAMKRGCILGIIHVVIFVIVYFLVSAKLSSFTYLFVALIINTVYCIFNGISWRKHQGGNINYGNAFRYIFILLAFNGLVGILFNYGFLLVEPTYPDVMAQSQLDVQLTLLGRPIWNPRKGN